MGKALVQSLIQSKPSVQFTDFLACYFKEPVWPYSLLTFLVIIISQPPGPSAHSQRICAIFLFTPTSDITFGKFLIHVADLSIQSSGWLVAWTLLLAKANLSSLPSTGSFLHLLMEMTLTVISSFLHSNCVHLPLDYSCRLVYFSS